MCNLFCATVLAVILPLVVGGAGADEHYPGLQNITSLPQHSILSILRNPAVLSDTSNITYVFNITSTHLGHMPQLEKRLDSDGLFTLWIPNDHAMREAAPRWESMLAKNENITGANIEKTWNMTETNQTVESAVMQWTHAGLMWSITKGNISLFSLAPENLFRTMLGNDTQFVILGKNATTSKNETQKIRVVRGVGNMTVFGHHLQQSGMMPTNHTDVAVISGSGRESYQRGHVYRQINAKNGIIYVLDRAVDLPFNATEQLQIENATLFLTGVKKAGLNDTINSTPNVTLLVPTDEAIHRRMEEEKVSGNKEKWTKETMQAILRPYIINGTYYAQDLNSTHSLHALSGHTHNVSFSSAGELLINGNVSVIQANVLTRNGVIHFINDTFRSVEQQVIKQIPKARSINRFF